MKLHIQFRKAALVACAVLVMAFVPHGALSGEGDYTFKVHNTTDELITKILVSEDGEKYGFFDIGSGIKPGESMSLGQIHPQPELSPMVQGGVGKRQGRRAGEVRFL